MALRKSEEKARPIIEQIIEISFRNVCTVLCVLRTHGDRRLEKIFIQAMSNGAGVGDLEPKLLAHFQKYGPSPAVFLDKLYKEFLRGKSCVCDEAVRTEPNGLCIGPLCKLSSPNYRFRIPVGDFLEGRNSSN